MTVPSNSGCGGVPAAREHATLRRYPLRRLRLPIGGKTLSMVVPDERVWLRDGRGASGPPPRRGGADWEPPYWMRVWPAALGLARALSRVGDLHGLHVLDLGCGLGVPGCLAAARGAEVTFVDREVDALAFAHWNAVAQGGPGRITATELDWSSATVARPFDLVLLSDVSYHQMHHAALERQLQASMIPGAVAMHSDPMRPAASAFLDGLEAAFSVVRTNRSEMVDAKRIDIRLSLLKRAREQAPLWERLTIALAGVRGDAAVACRSCR